MTSRPIEPEFALTTHARERMAERIRVSPRKMEKLCRKAWYGNSLPIPKLITRANRNEYFFNDRDPRILRELMGFVFVFRYGNRRPAGLPPQKCLITVV